MGEGNSEVGSVTRGEQGNVGTRARGWSGTKACLALKATIVITLKVSSLGLTDATDVSVSSSRVPIVPQNSL